MNLISDIFLRDEIWNEVFKLKSQKNNPLSLFERNVDLFIIASSIGLSDDEKIDDSEKGQIIFTIGRNTIQHSDLSEILLFIYQNAILHTKYLKLSMEEREQLAFDVERADNKYSINNFIVPYANYGARKIAECITDNDIETIINLKKLFDLYINKVELDDIEL